MITLTPEVQEIADRLSTYLSEALLTPQVKTNGLPLTRSNVAETIRGVVRSTLSCEGVSLPKYIKSNKFWEVLGTSFHYLARTRYIDSTAFDGETLQRLHGCFHDVLAGDFTNSKDSFLVGELPSISLWVSISTEEPTRMSVDSSSKCYVASVYDVIQYLHQDREFFQTMQRSYQMHEQAFTQQVTFEFEPVKSGLQHLLDKAFSKCGREARPEELLEINCFS